MSDRFDKFRGIFSRAIYKRTDEFSEDSKFQKFLQIVQSILF